MDSRHIKGYTLAFIAATTYGLNPLFALPLMSSGINTSSILFLRYICAIPVVGAMMLARGRSFKITPRQLGLLVVFGLLTGMSSLALFESYRYMEAGIASTILFIYPLLVALTGVLFFKEKLSKLMVICLIGALAGIALLYNGEGGETLSPTGTIWVMVSALSYALYIVGINRSELAKVPTLRVTFYVLIFGSMIFTGNLAFSSFTLPTGPLEWGAVAALAVLPTAVSFLCTTAAITYIGSTPTAILGAMEPLTAVVIGILVFDESLTGGNVAGLILILTAVTFVILGSSAGQLLTSIRRLFPRKRR